MKTGKKKKGNAKLITTIGRLNPIISEEVDLAFQHELPPCKEWTRVPLNMHLLRIIAKVSGRIFIGPELCRTEEYIDMAINYTVQTMQAVHAISNIAQSERKSKAGSLPEVKELRARQKTAYEFIKPVVEARKKAMKENPDFQKPSDTLQWILDDGQAKYGEQDDEELTQLQLALTFAAIHTTTMTTTNAMYCLAVMPDLVLELREEIRTVLKEYGDFTAAALQKMKKLDSFLREVMRVHPLGWSMSIFLIFFIDCLFSHHTNALLFRRLVHAKGSQAHRPLQRATYPRGLHYRSRII